ncbi:VCBS repeat-containing protein [Streptomyces roseus]|uniref:VCBS repeat-containing protein n=1 Tax=Streptomyces roseus TaxID=66430 RepID=UPI000B2FABA1|nr:VCBS repeat-containing protein [Streptomyces roseus]
MADVARFRYDASGRDGLLAVWPNGDLYAYQTDAVGLMNTTKRKLWSDSSRESVLRVTPGDFSKDGRDDMIGVMNGGSLYRWDGKASNGLNPLVKIWPDTRWTGIKIMSGDVDGAGKTDLLGWWGQNLNLSRAMETAPSPQVRAPGPPSADTCPP